MQNKQNDKDLIQIVFLKLGGTWDMIHQNGKLVGSGGLDDEALFTLEESLGFYKEKGNFNALEYTLAKAIAKNITQASNHTYDLDEHLSWVPGIEKQVTGKFISLFSGDSSHLRPSIIAPLVSSILKLANADPSVQILAAQGTDTADIAILSLLDAFTFDTSLLPILVTGSNRPHTDWNSDAPKNFSDVIKLAGAHIPSGAYWIFASHLYRASDFVKIDPLETRRIENFSTFFAPRITARFTKKVIAENQIFHHPIGIATKKNHISQKISTESLYQSLTSVDIVDLGNQSNIHDDVEIILRKESKAVIVSAHSLGNASNPIKAACIEATKNGKIVLIVSRSLIGEVNSRYAASILGENEKKLLGSGKQILSGHKLNKNVAKAIVTRAIEEQLDQQGTQELINKYCESRGLLN